MNNEEKILEILLQMQQEQKTTNDRLSKLETGQAKLESSQAELKSEMNERFDSVDRNMNEILKDLGMVEDRVDLHDAAIKKIM